MDGLVLKCLEETRRFSQDLLEKKCIEDPALASALREQFDALQKTGLLGPYATGSPTLLPEDTDARNLEPVGPYRPLKELGRGGQAVVYLAEDMRLHRPVALKILKGLGPLSETVVRRFRREAEVASRLDHPGICAVYDAGVKKGVPYIAMRYVEGTSLSDRIREARKQITSSSRARQIGLPVENGAESARSLRSSGSRRSSTRTEIDRILLVMEKAACALHVAHEAGIVHRDIKPGNIMVTPSGEAVLLDFGMAGDEDGGLVSLTQTGDMLGTPAYMSPEQLMARRIRLDRRTDVYSLGVTLFECLTLQRPFKAATREALYQAIQYKPPLSARKLNPRLPVDLEVVLETALEKDRDRRYQTALDLAEDLRRVRDSEPIQARPVGTVVRAARWAKRRPAHAALLAVVMLGLPLLTGLVGFVIANGPVVARAAALETQAAVEGRLEIGFSELGHGSLENADARFDEALALNPDSAEAMAGRLAVLLGKKNYRECIVELDRCRDLEETYPALKHYRALALSGLGQRTEAAALVKQIPEPRDDTAYFLAGAALLHGGPRTPDKAAARDALEHIRQAVFFASHARPIYYFVMAKAAADLEDETEAHRVAEALTTLWPGSALAEQWAGIALLPVDPGAASAAFQEAVQQDPDDYRSWFWLGAALTRTKAPGEEVLRAYDRVLALKPEHVLARYERGLALRRMGRTGEAVTCFERVLELEPGRVEAHLALAEIYWEEQNLNRALDHIRNAYELEPGSRRAFPGMLRILRRMRRWQDVVAECRKAVKRWPGSANHQIDLGCSLALVQEKWDEAEACFQKALPLESGNDVARLHLGMIQLNQGNFTGALASLRLVKKLPDSTRVGFLGTDSTMSRVGGWIRELERMIQLQTRLAAAIRREFQPADPSDRERLAWIAGFEERPGDAATLWARAFQQDPALAGKPCTFCGGTNRYLAARKAASASSGEGRDAGDYTREDRDRWRAEALAWLREELDSCREQLRNGQASERQVLDRLEPWKTDKDLAGLREPGARHLLPRSEQNACRELWAEVDRLLSSLCTKAPLK